MIGILILSLTILLAGALPWSPYSASARANYHRPWDWLMNWEAVTGENDLVRDRPDLRVGEPRRRDLRGGEPRYAVRHTAAAGAGQDLLVA
jgi:hypothetical protein